MIDPDTPSALTARIDQLVRVLPAAVVMVLLVHAILTAATLIPSALTTTVLGVSDAWDPTPWLLALPAAMSLVMAFVIHWGTARASAGHYVVRDLTRVARGIGLVLERRYWARAAVLGILGALAATVLGEVLIRVPALTVTNVPDARDAAVAGHPAWVQGLYFAAHAVLIEELIFRGPLIALTLLACRYIRPGPTRTILLTGLLLGTSLWFGYAHFNWSLANAVITGVTGLIYGLLALGFRSVWPAVLAHAGYNFTIALV